MNGPGLLLLIIRKVMKYNTVILANTEFEHLKEIMSGAQFTQELTYRLAWEKFRRELKEAKLLDYEEMPADVIRFYSMVQIETPWNVKKSYQIVPPEKADLKNNRISVLAPMSLALFGYAEGDEFEWQFPVGIKKIKILEVVNFKPQIKVAAV